MFQQRYFVAHHEWNIADRLLEGEMPLEDVTRDFLIFFQARQDSLRLPRS